MGLLTRLNRPWLHFVALGSLLYYLQQLWFPSPKPVIGPLSETRIDALRQQWFASVGRAPTPAQMQRMVEAELDRDMLFQRALELRLHLYDTVVYQRLLMNMRFLQMGEGRSDESLYQAALDMRLHLGDEVIKRRLVQVMEQLLLAIRPPAPPTAVEIAAEFEQRREELRRPPRYSIRHIFLSREREGEFDAVVARIREQGMTPEAALALSSPFLPGYEFTGMTPDLLARHFGAAFVENLESLEPWPGQWVGPVRSTYGLHYVWVSDVEPAREATLEEVRPQLLRDLELRIREEALRERIIALRERYEIRR